VSYNEGDDCIQVLAQTVLKFNPSCVGWQLDNERTTPQDSQALEAFLLKGNCNMVDLSGVIRGMRSTKSQSELALMRRAGEIACISMKAALETASNSMNEFNECTESMIAGAAAKAGQDAGGDYLAYPYFICAGANGALGHYAANQVCVPIRCGQSALFEIGGAFQRYHGALMRTAHILEPGATSEELPPHLQVVESCVQAALQNMRLAAVPGAKSQDVFKAGFDKLEPLIKDGWVPSQRSGYSIGIGFPTDWGECDEIIIRPSQSGDVEKLLPANATLHLLPWVYHCTHGGVGISDTVVIQSPQGAESLLPANKPPEKIFVIKRSQPQLEQVADVKRMLGDMNEPTPCIEVAPNSSSEGGLDLDFTVIVKDESTRLKQLAFKGLGGSYACAKALVRRLEGQSSSLSSASSLTLKDLKRKEGEEVITFTTATDGNHGAGVAWAATQLLGHRAVVYMPKCAAKSRSDRIREKGGEVHVTDLCYDDAVAMAAENAKKNGWELIQDTSWEGYTQVPGDIMSAYKLVAHEALESIRENVGSNTPFTHMIVQVGVGSFAAAIVQYMREALGRTVHIITIEAQNSNCLQQSLQRGVKTDVAGSIPTVAAGLDCGVVSDIAWPTLRNEVYAAVAISDDVAADGVRALHRIGIQAGESGAATGVGFLRAIRSDMALRKSLKLTSDSRVLVFNTEGTTDAVVTGKILSNEAYTNGPGEVSVVFSPHEIC
jgi:diaminopropionate ammonia-lyase